MLSSSLLFQLNRVAFDCGAFIGSSLPIDDTEADDDLSENVGSDAVLGEAGVDPEDELAQSVVRYLINDTRCQPWVPHWAGRSCNIPEQLNDLTSRPDPVK